MTNYFLPRHLGIAPEKKKRRGFIRSRSNRPAAVNRRKLYEQALREKKAEVAAEQQGVPVGQGDESRIHCEFCLARGTTHPWKDPHHIAGRRGTNLYDKSKLRLICRKIHDKAHHRPLWAKSVGLLQ